MNGSHLAIGAAAALAAIGALSRRGSSSRVDVLSIMADLEARKGTRRRTEPKTRAEVTAFVVLHNGQRLGWKIMEGDREQAELDLRYYGRPGQRPPMSEITQQRATFSSWDDAVRWCASFPAHPAEGVTPPGLDGYPSELTDAEKQKIKRSRVDRLPMADEPEKEVEVTAFVVLHRGRRLGWKVMEGSHERPDFDLRYYGRPDQRPPMSEITQQRETFSSWDDAVRWCASFPAHPAEGVAPPRPRD